MVDHLYDAALCTSSRRTYGTGQRAYFKFASEIRSEKALSPFTARSLNATELHLSFYMAFLILKPTITKASTILNYEGHVKYFFREHGCDELEYSTPFLGQIRRGINNTYPQLANTRRAFLLPHFVTTKDSIAPGAKAGHLVRLATVMGFKGMLRPHTFSQL